MNPDASITLSQLLTSSESSKKIVLLDINFSTIWTNDSNFFGENFYLLDKTAEIIDMPIKQERIISIRLNNTKYSAELIPLIDGIDVKSYVLSVKTTDILLKMVEHSQLATGTMNVVNVLKSDLNRIISIAGMLESQFEDKKMSNETDLIHRQQTSAERMLTNCNNLIDLFDSSVIKPKESLINIADVLESIYFETQKCLSSVKRLIDFSKPEDDALVNFNEKKFTSTVMNIIQNALLYSPPKSTIGIKLTYEKGSAVIRISNTYLTSDTQNYDSSERANIGKLVASKLLEECNGSLTYSSTDNSVTAEISLPIISGESNKRLSASFEDFISERYKPVHLFLNEIIENEKK